MSGEERRSYANGIWLCQNDAKLIDNDAQRFSVDLLHEWKRKAEEGARFDIEGPATERFDHDTALEIYSWVVTKRSADLAQKEFITTHRPRIVVREVVVWQLSSFEKTFAGEEIAFNPGERLLSHVEMVNAGDTTANVEFMCQMIYWAQEALPMVPPYRRLEIQRLEPPVILEAGQRTTWGGGISRKPIGPEAGAVTLCNDKWRLYVMGWIRYRDDLQRIRETRFCRERQYLTGRFRAIDDPDYECED